VTRMFTRTRLHQSLLLPACAAAALLASGCATKGFVREYMEGQMAPQRDATGRLASDLNAVRARADSADAHATAAQLMAQNALNEAAAARRLASKIASGELKYNVVRTHEVNFGFNEYSLDGRSRRELDQVAAILEQHPRYIVEIVGGADHTGSARYNLRLGEERAESVRRYLNDEHRVPLSKMATISYGAGKPVSQGEGKLVDARNRRAEIRVLEVQDVDLAAMSGTPDPAGTP